MKYVIKEFPSAGRANAYLQGLKNKGMELKEVHTSVVPYRSTDYKIILTIAYEDNFVGDFTEEDDKVEVL